MAKKFLPYEVTRQNKGSISSRNPNLTRQTIQDSKDGVIRRQLAKKVFQENILEGQTTFIGYVVMSLSEDSESNAFWTSINSIKTFLFPEDGQAGASKKYVCYLPEIHGMFDNPLNYLTTTVEEFAQNVELIREIATFSVATDVDVGIGVGSSVVVTFTDTQLTQGFISEVLDSTERDTSAIPASVAGARAASVNGSSIAGGTPGEPYPGLESSNPLHLEPGFRAKINTILKNMEARGLPFVIRATFRDSTRQNYYKSQGWSSVSKSYHMNVDMEKGRPAALAADLVPRDISVEPPNQQAADAFLALSEEAQRVGLTTGATWFGGNLGRTTPWRKWSVGWDPAHVEDSGIGLSNVNTSEDYFLQTGREISYGPTYGDNSGSIDDLLA
jgi:hypothetical protein